MATDQSLVEFICSQGRGAQEPVYKKMSVSTRFT